MGSESSCAYAFFGVCGGGGVDVDCGLRVESRFPRLMSFRGRSSVRLRRQFFLRNRVDGSAFLFSLDFASF